MPVIWNEALQKRVWSQMEVSYPNEGGGFLLGEIQGKHVYLRNVIQIENVFTEAEQYHRYIMTPADFIRLEDEAEAQGLSLVGYYHSHPNAPAVPSRFDRDHAWPNFIYLITSVVNGQAVHSRGWRLQADRSRFNEAMVKLQD
ncbi:MAG: M67 family metallopeptidase [Anaerolineaceae bacterium]|nr:M67 family metallopeptidase [Anaerolineaceae bacterium]